MTKGSLILASLLAGLLVVPQIACGRKLSDAAVQAQADAKSADDRVAQLEKELADLKAGKAGGGGDADAVEHVSKSQEKALDRRLKDARQAAVAAHKEADTLAANPSAPKPVVVEVPSGTALQVTLARELATDKDQAGDPWDGALAEDVAVGGKVAWPAGTPVKGVVAQSTPAGRLKSGQGGLGIRLSAVGRNDVEAGTYVVTGGKRGERNAEFIGGGAALGALVGILSGRGHQADHALGGAVIGAAAGTGLAAGTADTIIRIPNAKPVTFRLTAPERVTVK